MQWKWSKIDDIYFTLIDNPDRRSNGLKFLNHKENTIPRQQETQKFNHIS